MPAPLPSPDEITRRAEARLEAALKRIRPDKSPAAVARAVRSERGMLAAIARVQGQGLYNTHLHLRWNVDQLLPDTAEPEFLIRHASIWGVYRRPATKAVGYALFTGIPGTAVPAGLDMRLPGGGLAVTSAGGVLDGAGQATIALEAAEGGVLGNTAGGASLPIVTVQAGLDPQTATLDADGMAGGAEEENDVSLLARVLAEIREPGHGGNKNDYRLWIQNAFAVAKVATVPLWVGPGSVGVVVAMGTAVAPLVPIPAELDAMAAHLDPLRPVTAEVYVRPVVLLPVPLQLAVVPNTLPVRAAVEGAGQAHFAAEAQIGERFARSRLSEALSAASGEYRHYIALPPADVVPDRDELPVWGGVTWDPPP
ncbi:baseplate J/gp47 family protein [Bosea sp. FBZP-16]|uniref:baseplate J/gp47 family protein n=1 Tax=Bosea sp. FBZP-16 TaxID=2065382 RepID=UPI000C315CAA|nr:baseplate J/gp47 family protein [Bosea sp. FBZP-16]